MEKYSPRHKNNTINGPQIVCEATIVFDSKYSEKNIWFQTTASVSSYSAAHHARTHRVVVVPAVHLHIDGSGVGNRDAPGWVNSFG